MCICVCVKRNNGLNKNGCTYSCVMETGLFCSKDHHKLEKVKSLKESLKRVSVAPDHLPSICFYTFLNSYSG